MPLHQLDLNHRTLDFWSSTTLSHHSQGIDIFAFIYLHIIIINCFSEDILIIYTLLSRLDKSDINKTSLSPDLLFSY